MLAIYI